MDYDEARELTHYVWAHCQGLMTPFERYVGYVNIVRAKAARSKSERMREWLHPKCAFGEPQIEAALADGPEAFCRRVRDRLLAEQADALFINRCPACGRIVRTPLARQCFWCGFDWHGTDPSRTAQLT
jgi:hypothetical protein